MKKLLRYLVNTILFVAIWCVPAFIFVGISLSVSGTRPSAIAGVGGIVAIIISYRLVKRINKSKLWSRLFDETEVINEVVEEKKVEVVDSNIFNPKNITIGILAIVLISFLYFQFGGILENTNDYNIPEQKTEINLDSQLEKVRANINLINEQRVFNTTGYITRVKHFEKLSIDASIGCDVRALNIDNFKHPALNRDVIKKLCDKASVLYADAAINAVNNAINLDHSNSYLYFQRGYTYWNKAALNCYWDSQGSEDNYRFMVLDLQTAISLYPQGKPVGSSMKSYFYNTNPLSEFYNLLGMAKIQGLNLAVEGCRDIKTACNLGNKSACEDYKLCQDNGDAR